MDENSYFRAIRYEEFVTNMLDMTDELLDFIGLGMEPSIERLIKSLVEPNFLKINNILDKYNDLELEYQRDPWIIMNAWRLKLTFKEILAIQEQCDESLEIWGYKKVITEADLYREDHKVVRLFANKKTFLIIAEI
jgi:hypothetical protein